MGGVEMTESEFLNNDLDSMGKDSSNKKRKKNWKSRMNTKESI